MGWKSFSGDPKQSIRHTGGSAWPAEAGGLRDKFNSGQRATIHPRRMLQNTLFGVEGLDLTGDIVLTPSRLHARFT